MAMPFCHISNISPKLNLESSTYYVLGKYILNKWMKNNKCKIIQVKMTKCKRNKIYVEITLIGRRALDDL